MSALRLSAVAAAVCVVIISLAGCGAGTTPSFTLDALPNSVVLTNSGPAQAITIGANSLNSFNGAVNVMVTGLPSGITATPATLTLSPGTLQQIWLTASGAAVGTPPGVTIVGTSGGITSSLPVTLQVAPALTTATLSTTSFHFGENLIGNTLTRSAVSVSNTGTAALSLNPVITGDAGFALATPPTSKQCGATLAAGATCVLRLSFTPPNASPATVTATLNLGLGNVQPGTPTTVALSGSADVLPPGVVTATANPQVALYTLDLPFPGAVTVSFGPDTTYGRNTWTQSGAAAGPVSILVAGMLPNTTYHMQAAVTFTNGIVTHDVDQTFTTKAPLLQPQITASTTPGMSPQPGAELLTLLNGPVSGLALVDLAGNTLWSYVVSNPALGNQVQGAKLMPNGHFLITLGQTSNYVFSIGALPQGSLDSAVEIDLAGNIIRQITTAELSAELVASGYDLQLLEFHHDITPLPNGHWLVLANVFKTFQDLPGYPGALTVLGDVIVDLDTNLQPAWVWNSFDHLDINRHPLAFPDWTHANAIVYSPSDGNILFSLRNQNWVLKLDYNNGAGDGNILWRLGEGGDFTLSNGIDPQDWNYAQHYPSVFSSNSAGNFTLGMVDNGDDRQFASGVVCNSPPGPPCLYTTIPLFQIDEAAKTATLVSHQVLNPSLYSVWGGSVDHLANGNLEYTLSGLTSGLSAIYEVTSGATPTTVWQLNTTGGSPIYRGVRMPSLYPGVQW